MLKIICALLMIGVLTTQANAEWEQVGTTNENIYLIDPDKIRTASEYGKSYLKVWVKRVIYNDITKDGLSVGDYEIDLWHIDCNGLTSGLKSYAEYKKSGILIKSNQTTYVEMNDVIPNSVGEAVLEKACLYQ
jgi:hypothetical protein